ncbi:tetratricopeptide repeat protein [Verrucomicrobiota bacterium]
MAEKALTEVPQKTRDLYNKGFVALERGNLDYAIDLLFSCVKMEPRLSQARKYLRIAEIQRGKQKKKNIFSKVVSSVSGSPAYLKTMKLIKTGKFEAALESAEDLLKNDPLNPEFVKIFAQAADAAGLTEVAIQTLELVQESCPDSIPILNILGKFYQETGQTKSARECFEKVCALAPHDSDAIKILKDAMAVDSMNTDGWQSAAKTGGSFREMIKDTDKAVLLEQESKAVKADKDVDALIAEYQNKIEAEPGNINYYRGLSRLYAERKMFNEAVSILKKALELSPGDPELDNALTEVQTQQFDDEIVRLQEAGEATEAKQVEKAQFIFDNMQERIKRYPNDLKLRFEWGVMLFNNDYINEAIQQFQMSQRSPKHRIRTLYHLAMCFKKKEQYDLALEQLEGASSEIPIMDTTKKDVLYELGEIQEIIGNPAKAAEYYKQIYQVDIGYKDIAARVEKVYQKK